MKKNYESRISKKNSLPQRTCIACRKIKSKREMVRLVRVGSGLAEIDLTGKKSGRGAYLCLEKDCWESGLKINRLEYALRTKLAPENLAQLAEWGKSLPRQEKYSG